MSDYVTINCEPTPTAIDRAARCFVGEYWDKLDGFGRAKARTRARAALMATASGEPAAWLKYGGGRRFIRFTKPEEQEMGWIPLYTPGSIVR